MKKIFDFITSLFSRNNKSEVYKNTIKGSNISGNINQSNTIIKLESKETVEEFTWQVVTLLKDNFFVDTQSDKFQFYINQAILILKLNDSDLKRETLKRLLYMKFAESNPSEDDSDAPLTLALDAMRYMTDKSLRHLTSYRLLVNILPSILNSSDLDGLLTIKEYIDQNRFMNSEEILNLRRCGMIYEMSTSIYSLEAIAKGVDAELNLTDSIVTLDENILANGFTQAGIILTDITLGYFLNFHGQYDIWLPIRHKSLHVNDLIVDNDAQVNQNMIVRGDTSSGG